MGWIIFIVYAVVCAALCAWIWKANARPPLVGGLIGLLFGLAGIIVSLLVFMTGNRKRRAAGAV